MDVGCGSGLMLPRLSEHGSAWGIEVDTDLLSARTPMRDRIFSAPLGAPLYRDMSFDLITCLDVLEHIEDDREAVANMMAMLRPGGTILITVPAFMLLWDEHDVINQHHRRYTRPRLRTLLAPHGQLVRVQHLFASLLAPKLALKLANRCRRHKIPQHRVPGTTTSKLMARICMLEYRFAAWARLPGTSLLAVVRKPMVAADELEVVAPMHRAA